MALESRFTSFSDVADKGDYTSVSVSIVGKSTWTDPVISDMLDSAAVRQDARVSHTVAALVSVQPITKEIKVVDKDGKETVTQESTGQSTFSRVYYFHSNPPAVADAAKAG